MGHECLGAGERGQLAGAFCDPPLPYRAYARRPFLPDGSYAHILTGYGRIQAIAHCTGRDESRDFRMFNGRGPVNGN